MAEQLRRFASEGGAVFIGKARQNIPGFRNPFRDRPSLCPPTGVTSRECLHDAR
jgi:hypothetical protein